jgi:hypothetical protein
MLPFRADEPGNEHHHRISKRLVTIGLESWLAMVFRPNGRVAWTRLAREWPSERRSI